MDFTSYILYYNMGSRQVGRIIFFFPFFFFLSFLLNCEFNINVSTQILLLFHPYDAQASSTCSALILSGATIKLGK